MTADITVGLVRLEDIRFHPHNIRQDLGDLRALTDSIGRFGVMQPVVVEKHNGALRLRAGHRRVAAAKIAGLTRVPAVIHAEALDEDDWLAHSVQENVMRRGLLNDERRRAIDRLRDLGCSWTGIADVFGASESTVRKWGAEWTNSARLQAKSNARKKATRRLIANHRPEFESLLIEEGAPGPEVQPAPPGDYVARTDALVEDVEWMAGTGAGLAEVLRRRSTSREALYVALTRRDRLDLWERLRRADGIDVHGTPISEQAVA